MRIFLVLILVAAASSVAFPAASDPSAPSATAGAEAAAGAVTAVPPLQLAGQAAEGFVAGRAARFAIVRAAQGEAGVAAAIDDGLADALLDLATFHLAHGLVPEGASVVASLGEASLGVEREARRRLLGAMFSALDTRVGADPAIAVEVLEASRPYGVPGILLAHAQQRLGRPETAVATLSHVVDDLDALPADLAVQVLPDLLGATVTVEDWALASRLAERVAVLRSPGDGALPYLMGKAALGGGDLPVAFERFVDASAARDVWGHRARMEIVALGQETGAIDAVEALSMLHQAHALWRGDADEVRTLLEIERVAAEAGIANEAILALGEVIARHGGSPEAPAAAERAVSLVHAFYRDGTTGAIPLDDFVEGHREIADVFRFFPGFAEASEGFADHMLSVGATAAAAREYRLTREYLEAAGALGLDAPDPGRLDALRLKEAEARLAGGQGHAAGALLAAPLVAGDAALDSRLAVLRARHFAITGERAFEVDLDTGPGSETFLRLVAEAHAAAGEWDGARAAYVALRDLLGDDLPLADAVGLLIAAHQSGDADLVAAVEPVLSRRGGIAAEAVTAGFAPDPLAATGLSADSARTLLQRAERAIGFAGSVAVADRAPEEENQE
ncbi:hypothetical protein P6F26_09340 [Roseibacterium sp. SDUM158017]|uniref:hypothetical protein n=1 Tax=Roseicyclus salinarum TaxID=3036773 RepID=UPI002414D2D0|nr:hypothetical protein [Roseibacterium sp. SDUM158017]MDG4648650.1 hypothetical protein [Roseibacterium sp. SDUM158017]